MTIYLLVIASAATLLSPWVLRVCRERPRTTQVVQGILVVVTAGIIVFQVLPKTFDKLGIWSIALALVGMGLPSLLESLFRRTARRTHVIALALGALGILLHGVVDGTAMAMSGYQSSDPLLALAITLHRLPIGLTLWWLVRPEFGRRAAWSILIALVTGTVLGYEYSEQMLNSLSGAGFMAFQALVSGTLLHVLLHQPGHQHEHTDSRSRHLHGGDGDVPRRTAAANTGPGAGTFTGTWLGYAMGVVLLLILLLLHRGL